MRAADAIRAVEKVTGCELVVAVRPRASAYRGSLWLAGTLAGFLMLGLLVWLPIDFDHRSWPLEVLGAGLLGAGLALAVPPLRALLTLRRRMRGEVRRSARAAFHDLGVGRTRGHVGVLVYVALLEREVAVVLDHGIDRPRLGAGWAVAVKGLRRALRPRRDFGAFLAALEALAPPLAAAVPRRADDENELPDELLL